MNTNNEFDELARQKLGERSFAFEEAHWLDAQRAIAADRKRRGGAAWWYAAAIVLVAGATWMLWPSEGTSVADKASTTPAIENNEANSPVEGTTAANQNEEVDQA
ncbi:MAG TPA: hypothetical protein PK760_05615, partial [Flavobacteriales bacterium]|nr:hypothetical protein [Flavobacteriales bacterium]